MNTLLNGFPEVVCAIVEFAIDSPSVTRCRDFYAIAAVCQCLNKALMETQFARTITYMLGRFDVEFVRQMLETVGRIPPFIKRILYTFDSEFPTISIAVGGFSIVQHEYDRYRKIISGTHVIESSRGFKFRHPDWTQMPIEHKWAVVYVLENDGTIFCGMFAYAIMRMRGVHKCNYALTIEYSHERGFAEMWLPMECAPRK